MALKEKENKVYFSLGAHLFYDISGKLYVWVDVTPWWRKFLNWFFIFGWEITEEPLPVILDKKHGVIIGFDESRGNKWP